MRLFTFVDFMKYKGIINSDVYYIVYVSNY